MNSLLSSFHAASQPMGMALGGAEILVILFVLGIPVLVVVVVLAVVKGSRGRTMPPPPDVQAETEARLVQIDGMLASGQLSKAEHAEQRKRILDSL